MKRIIAVEPGEWTIFPCMLEDDDCYRRVDVYPDGRIEASDEERFNKADIYGPDYRLFAKLYIEHSDYMLFLRQPITLSPHGTVAPPGLKRLATLAWRPLLVEV
jgi:hypothetical protein